jgi:uncharacterized membrane protein YgdD (TMEM256/DUF423 family)
MMISRNIFITGTALMAISVMLGAFGAHALKPILLQHNRIETFELGVRYQVYHALAILLLGLLATKLQPALLRAAWILFVLGILFFSGSLYYLSLTNQTTLVLVTPLGGTCFIGAWLTLMVAFIRMPRG